MNPIEEHLNSMFERKLINLSSKYRVYLVSNLGSINLPSAGYKNFILMGGIRGCY